MATWLRTKGFNQIAIAICDRCRCKRPINRLIRDGDRPGLRVCEEASRKCWDTLDPRKLPPRQPDNITLQFPRPDVDISTAPLVGDVIPVEDVEF